MAAGRKLQAEIEKVLKKVEEGIEEFNNVWENVHSAVHANQREKFEAELKTQIKKLQRDREQIKIWQSDKSIKDKNVLAEARKKIEVEMERFKEFERDSKTKQYSKEGLSKSDKVDPHEEERSRHRTWIQESIDKLHVQIDEIDADAEAALSTKKSKSGKQEDSALAHLRTIQETHRWHATKLEQLLRKLDNDEVALTELDDLRDTVEYYVDENSRAAGEFQPFDTIYESFGLEDVEDYLAKDRERAESREEATEKEDASSYDKPSESSNKSEGRREDEPIKAPTKHTGGVRTAQRNNKEEGTENSGSQPQKAWPPMVSVWQNPLPATSSSVEKPGPPPKPGPPVPRPAPTLPPPMQPAPDRPPPPGQAPVLNAPPNQPPPKPAPHQLPQLQPPMQAPHQLPQLHPPTQAPPQPPLPSPPLGSPPRPQAPPSSTTAAMPAPPPMPPPAPSDPGVDAVASQPLAGAAMSEPPATAPPPPPPPPLPPPPPSPAPAPSGPPSTTPVLPPGHAKAAPVEPEPAQWPPCLPDEHLQQAPKVPPPSEAPPPPAESPPPPPQEVPSSSGEVVAPTVAPPPMRAERPERPERVAAVPPPASSSGPATAPSASFEPGGVMPPPPPTAVAARPEPGMHAPPPVAPESRRELSPRRANALQLLAASHRHLPLPSDSRRKHKYSPRNPYVHLDQSGNAAYPMQPTQGFEDPAVFKKYDTDTLFFIFYYQQASYLQHLAAKELKKLSWRYHTKYLTWFQRHEEPRMTASDFERGAYVYFDHNTDWCQRIKSDFTFEYQYLEDEPM